MAKPKPSKIYAFIDSQNLNLGVRSQGWQLDWRKFRQYLGNKYDATNVDAELVLHTMVQYKNYDKAIIVTGDGDFYCLVEYLEDKKKLYRILVPNKHHSALLRKFNDYVSRVDLLRDSLELKKAKISGRSKP